MPIPISQRRTCTVEQAAELLGIQPSEVYILIQSGQLPAHQAGSRLVLSRSAIDDLLHGETPDPAA
jgi:excisionase family DNA binding protein